MLLKWYNQKCSHVPYLLKCDDDVFLNTKKLYNLVSNITVDDVLIGYLFCDNKPVRDKESIWYVSKSVYSEDSFPPHLNGPGYLISSNAAQKLFRAARHVPQFMWEDVYLTGMVAREAGITPDDNIDFNQFIRLDACIYSEIILAPSLTISEITSITKRVEDLDKVECRNRGILQKRPLYVRCCSLHQTAYCHKKEKLKWRNYHPPVTFLKNELLYEDQWQLSS